MVLGWYIENTRKWGCGAGKSPWKQQYCQWQRLGEDISVVRAQAKSLQMEVGDGMVSSSIYLKPRPQEWGVWGFKRREDILKSLKFHWGILSEVEEGFDIVRFAFYKSSPSIGCRGMTGTRKKLEAGMVTAEMGGVISSTVYPSNSVQGSVLWKYVNQMSPRHILEGISRWNTSVSTLSGRRQMREQNSLSLWGRSC